MRAATSFVVVVVVVVGVAAALSSSPSSGLGGGTVGVTTTTKTTLLSSLRAENREALLNLVNHPLQIQVASGALPLGSLRRQCVDRAAVLAGLQRECLKVAGGGFEELAGLLGSEAERVERSTEAWVADAEAAGKSLVPEDDTVRCYACGGRHLNIDCPSDLEVSGAAAALVAVVQGPVGVYAVLDSLGWTAAVLKRAGLGGGPACCYDGFLEATAACTKLADRASQILIAGDYLDDEAETRAFYGAALSALYNVIDNEATTTGLRGGTALDDARRRIEELEPGFLAQQDRHAQFVRALVDPIATNKGAAKTKLDLAAAYLAAKKAATDS